MSRLAARQSSLALLLGIVVGLVLVSLPLSNPAHVSHTVLNPGPGLSSKTAYNEVDEKVNSLPGGPWGLISMEGVVATAPAAPFAWGQDRCQTLPGPTMWNLSRLPTLTTTLWGGNALFWQLVYINDTESMVFGSNANGSVTIDGPYSPSTPCVLLLEGSQGGLAGSTFPPSYWLPGAGFDEGLLATLAQLNSTSWAPTAATHLGNVSMAHWGGAMVAYYTLGYTWLNIVEWTSQAWLVWYQACGVPGRSTLQPYTTTGWGLNSSPAVYAGSESGGVSCPVTTDSHFQVSYNQTSTASIGSGQAIEERLTIGVGYSGSYAYFDTANSLVSWMARVSLNASNGTAVTPAAEECTVSATSLAGCAVPSRFWYAALLSPNGYLLDTYPTVAGGNQWETPNVFITNNDTLVIVSASNLIGTGDGLSLVPAAAFPSVLGGITI